MMYNDTMSTCLLKTYVRQHLPQYCLSKWDAMNTPAPVSIFLTWRLIFFTTRWPKCNNHLSDQKSVLWVSTTKLTVCSFFNFKRGLLKKDWMKLKNSFEIGFSVKNGSRKDSLTIYLVYLRYDWNKATSGSRELRCKLQAQYTVQRNQ